MRFQSEKRASQHPLQLRQILRLGLVEGLTKVVYPEASAVVIFVIMIFVLLFRPAGLFGKQA